MKPTHIDHHTSSAQTSVLLGFCHPRKDIPDITFVATSSETVADYNCGCVGRKSIVIFRSGINAPDLALSEHMA